MRGRLTQFYIPQHLKDKFPLLKEDDFGAISDQNPDLVLLVHLEDGFLFVLAAKERVDRKEWFNRMLKVYKSLCKDDESSEYLENLTLRSPEVMDAEEEQQMLQELEGPHVKALIGSVEKLRSIVTQDLHAKSENYV